MKSIDNPAVCGRVVDFSFQKSKIGRKIKRDCILAGQGKKKACRISERGGYAAAEYSRRQGGDRNQ